MRLWCRSSLNPGHRASVPQQKPDYLLAAVESGLFLDRELLVLSWAACVTNISIESDVDIKPANINEYINEAEVVDFILIVSLVNCLNRITARIADNPENVLRA